MRSVTSSQVMMRTNAWFALFIAFTAAVANADIDRAATEQAFAALQRNCSADNGKLWGVSLCGKMAVVEKRTRKAVANFAVDGFEKSGGVWMGYLPQDIGIANTAFDWNGQRWSMVMWPLPSDAAARDRLLIHERFHAVQRELGFPLSSPMNAHLDSMHGRYLLRMEMRALRAALLATTTRERKRAAADAAAFRRVRYTEFPGAAQNERALELSEGLAEYTAVRLMTPDRAVVALNEADKESGFVRSFAYATGPAWGLLADEFSPGWRKRIAAGKSIDGFVSPSRKPAAARYGGPDVLAEERSREEQRQRRLAEYHRRFIDGPVLTLPLQQMQMQFDPHDVHPFGDNGTVYEQITVSDMWGTIVVHKGALISIDYKLLTVAAGPGGFTLTLADGWRQREGIRPGDIVVEHAR